MKEIAGSKIGLYVIDLQDLKDERGKSLLSKAEHVKKAMKIRERIRQEMPEEHSNSDRLDMLKAMVYYDYDLIIKHANEKYNAEIPVDQGAIGLDLDGFGSAITEEKADMLTPGVIPYLFVGGYENNLIGLTEPRSAFWDRVFDKHMQELEDPRRWSQQAFYSVYCAELNKADLLQKAISAENEKERSTELRKCVFGGDLNNQYETTISKIFPRDETKEGKSASTWAKDMNEEIIECYLEELKLSTNYADREELRGAERE
ncbi:hypothetical protein RLOatenuis_3410 [Rickettsiales bacterium]|nr:hypothetical protein RLOatenuis_3410 [Rickettsiales bacterium]